MTDRLVLSPGPKLIWHFRDEEPVDVKQDADNATEFLERSFPGIRVMGAYRSLNGRGFRKAWSDITYATNDTGAPE